MHPHGVSFSQALRTWAYIGLNSFGGPAGQIAVMHRVLVEQKKWIGEQRFLHALNYCMLLPGPEAMQLTVYIGWLMHRTLGGLVAGLLFVLPGMFSILLLSLLYAAYQETNLVQSLLFGLKPAVMAVVLEAVMRIGRRALRSTGHIAIAVCAFLGIFCLEAPFPLIVLGAGLIGFVVQPGAASKTNVQNHGSSGKNTQDSGDGASGDSGAGDSEGGLLDHVPDHARPSWRWSVKVLLVCGVLWMTPLVLIGTLAGTDSLYFEQGIFFSKAAMVTFGGAYAVLGYVQQQAVEVYGWLRPGEMIDGLGLAETTPGPLIMVVQFVGFMGAFREAEEVPGGLDPLLAGTFASLLVTWVTFVPCFLWVFLGAPYMEALRGSRALTGALSCITAAVVGVILNLAVWFALHTLFTDIQPMHWNGVRLWSIQWSSVSWPSVGIAVLAVVLLFRVKLGMLPTLGICAAAGVVVRVLSSEF